MTALALVGSFLAAQTRPVSAQADLPPPVRILHSFREAWNSGRVERVLPFFADDAIVVDAQNGGTHVGRDAVFRWLDAQLDRETHIVSASDFAVGVASRGDAVAWNALLSTFASRSMRAPPVAATVETILLDGKIVSHTVTLDPPSLSRQRLAVRDAIATTVARMEAAGPDPRTLPPAPTYPPYEPIQLPNADDRRAPVSLPWLAVGAATLLCAALAILKRPPRP